MKKIIYVFLLLMAPFAAFSQDSNGYDKELGDAAYAESNFNDAIKIYEAVIAEQGGSLPLYYNLGNAYYRANQPGKAILNYERALLIDPSNADVKFNLELARSKTVDKNALMSELFFVRWYRDFAAIMSADAWSRVAILCFIILISCLALFIFSKKSKTKKIIFIFALLSVVSTIVANIIAADRKEKMVLRENAIVMEPSVTIRSTPSVNGTELFILHEGKKVKVKDDSMKDWKEIEIEDGNIGWIPASAIERI